MRPAVKTSEEATEKKDSQERKEQTLDSAADLATCAPDHGEERRRGDCDDEGAHGAKKEHLLWSGIASVGQIVANPVIMRGTNYHDE